MNKNTHQLLLLPKYSKRQVNSSLNYGYFSYLCRYINRYWGNQLDIFTTTSTKTAIFLATHLKKHFYDIPLPEDCPFLIIKRYMKDPMQIKRGKCYSLVLLCLKSTCMYKHNQVNKGILFQVFLHIILLMSTIYFRVFIMVWLGFWFDDTRGLRWGITLSCFQSFS